MYFAEEGAVQRVLFDPADSLYRLALWTHFQFADDVDRAIGDRLSKAIVGVNKVSTITCNQSRQRVSGEYACPTLMPPHHNTNFQPGPKVNIKVRLYQQWPYSATRYTYLLIFVSSTGYTCCQSRGRCYGIYMLSILWPVLWDINIANYLVSAIGVNVNSVISSMGYTSWQLLGNCREVYMLSKAWSVLWGIHIVNTVTSGMPYGSSSFAKPVFCPPGLLINVLYF